MEGHPNDLVLTNYMATTLFPAKVTFVVRGVRTQKYEF